MNTITISHQYKAFQEKRQALDSLIEQQLEVLRSLNMTGWEETIHLLKERVQADNFKVLVIGEFKRGKSTFINAMLGAEILPAYAKPCTAIINEIKWGDSRRALLHYKSSENGLIRPAEEVPIEQIEEYVVIHDGMNESEAVRGNRYKKVELFWPLELCRNGVEIVDSPGLNEHNNRQEVTMDYLPNVDAVLFILSCEALASKSELDVINNMLRSTGHEDIFFICNRFNMIRRREQESIKQYGLAKLAPLTKRGAERVFFISALDALEGRIDGDEARVESSGVPLVERELENFLANDRGQVKLLRPAMELKRAIQEARRVIPEREGLLQIDLKTLEARYADAQKPLRQLEKERQNIVQRISNFREDMKEVTRQKVRTFYNDVADKIDQWVEEYEIKEPINLFSPDIIKMQPALERVINELTSYLSNRVEGEFTNWQRQELQMFLESRLEALMRELDERAQAFVSQVDKVRLEVIAGNSTATSDVELEEAKISPLERILAATSGFFLMDFVSGGIGAVFGYKEMLKSLIPQIALIALAHAFVGFNPFILIPTIIAGGFIQGLIKIETTNDKIKKDVGNRYKHQISLLGQSDEIANVVAAKLNEIKTALDEGLGKEIQSIRDQVESIFAEKQKGQANVEYQLRQLESISQEISAIDSKLDAFITNVALP